MPRPRSLAIAVRTAAAARTALAPLLVLALAGCGATKDWGQEIVVQLFRPASLLLGTFDVRATQGNVSHLVTIPDDRFFESCSTNRIRIIPNDPVAEVVVEIAKGKFFAGTKRTISPKDPSPVPFVLDPTQPSMPVGDCAVKPSPPDLGVPRKPTGAACTGAGQCDGKLCLTEVINGSSTNIFDNGYCSRPCPSFPLNTDCKADERCIEYRDGNGGLVGRYCLLICPASAAPNACCPVGNCRNAPPEKYHCSPYQNCVP